MNRISIGISFDMKLITKIDSRRGDIPRSRFIEKILIENMGDETC